MSNAAAHNLIGAATGIVTAFLDQNPEEERFVLGSILAASSLVGSTLPDVLEPAIHSHHRKFFHSVIVLAGVTGATIWLWNWRPPTFEQRCLRASLCGLFIGYGSHLCMDAWTPRRLPFI